MTTLNCKRCQMDVDAIVNPNFTMSDGRKATRASCPHCRSFIKFLPRKPRNDFEFYFGKYRGRVLSEMKTQKELTYLQWCLDKIEHFKDWQKDLIEEQINKHS